jgi:cysteinyl-tRNA synthetase
VTVVIQGPGHAARAAGTPPSAGTLRPRTVRPISLHDTRTGRLTRLEPREDGRVGIYACGPTVYSRIHVGNARPFVVFSLFKRFLEHEGLEVTFVANVTDINDKIYDAARRAGVPSDELAREMTAHYFADTDRLGLGRPDHEPLATEYVDAIVALIAELVDRGHAYEARGDVYFSVRSLDSYGELSHQDVGHMDQGEGVEGAERKRDPADFALWKAAKPSEDTSWPSPWGAGRPGWHIECSAMAEALLGPEFEVHGGGTDLVFPHHENEAAQTLAARGHPLARIWMHNGMLQHAASEEKMSKSVGNIEGLADVLDDAGRDALLLYFSQGHYRQPLAFSRERLEDAARGVARIREAGRRLVPGASPEDLGPLRERFFEALAEDFNTARALAVVFDWVAEANRRDGVGNADLREMLGVLGLDNLLDAPAQQAPPDVVELVAARTAAREARDWAEADRLRYEARSQGWEIRDGPEGPELVPLA